MRHSYNTKGVCATKISFDLDGDIVRNVEFLGGCNGNLSAIQKLVDGFTVEKITEELGGHKCGMRTTSCTDQLSKAVETAYKKQGNF
jgi:uncharacterized protein (TIGR03905 family)